VKILELRFKNLNSLYGEWVIDFSNPDFVSNGIFALTGPTGAGKSTILDAICLALYGATPRLGKITKGGNEIMSRQTGECYAEVLFESSSGRFRCHFSQHRARKKADGDLQTPRHEIAEGIGTGRIIENQLRRVAEVIEEKTGMDFERFTRSILLAQGGFDTFLKADAEQKSKLLEQITGTGIYSGISRQVHQRQRQEHDSLNLLQAEISGIVIMEPEEELKILHSLEEKLKRESVLADESSQVAQSIAWLKTVNDLKNEITDLEDESLTLKSKIKAFESERNRLDQGLKAASLEGLYAALEAVRRQQSEDLSRLETWNAELPELESSADKQNRLLKSAEQQTLNVKEKLKEESNLIREVRSKDQKLKDQRKALSDVEEKLRINSLIIEKKKQALLEVQRKKTEAENVLKLIKDYLRINAVDEWLVGGLAGVEEQLGSLYAIYKKINQKETDHSKAVASLEQADTALESNSKLYKQHSEELLAVSDHLQQEKKSLDEILGKRLLREYRSEKEMLLREMAFLTRIEELESLRMKLEDGKPCPLCGSKEHPFAEGNTPVPDGDEKKVAALESLISKAEEQEHLIRSLEETEGVLRHNLSESEKQVTFAANEKLAIEKTLSLLAENLERLQDDFTVLKFKVLTGLKPLGITGIPEIQISTILGNLRDRLDNWQNRNDEKKQIEKRISEYLSEINGQEAVLETLISSLSDDKETLSVLEKDFAATSAGRYELYGDKRPDEEETRLHDAISGSEEHEKKMRSLSLDLQQRLNTTRTSVASLGKDITGRRTELEISEMDFKTELVRAGFPDEEQFIAVRLTQELLSNLTAGAKKLDESKIDLQARRKDRESRLAAELKRKLTDKSIRELEPVLKDIDDSLKELRDDIAGMKHRLLDNATALERIKEKRSFIAAQKKECRRWDNLHALIGSADGKKYRNFAQGLTFEIMVSHANRQLEKMTDRYLLIRDDQQPLELNVIDNFQAGEIRSTRNLSGGESFIISLTLALGLSKMSSRKVRVDSLFLDEGFGTLDEEALETALETLSGLHQDGKLIGIISHVSALKERIRTQITVSPVSGGKSILTGPGCSRIKNEDY